MATLSEADYQALEAYAVGATLFYALCQRLPFQADTPEDYLAAQQSSPPPRIDRVDDQLLAHKSLANTIVQCLALNPSERPSSLEALRRLLEEAEREARFQDSRVDFLPARVSETHEMSRPIRGDERDKPSEEVRSSVLPLLALVALIAIALFLIGR